MKTKKTFSLIFLCYLLFTNMIAQHHSHHKSAILGCITDSNGKPLPYATIAAQGTPFGTTSNEDGCFILNLKPGKYNLVFSYTGYNNKNQSVIINPQDRDLDLGQLQLTKTSQKISEVTIQSTRNAIHTEESQYIAKLPIKNLENPQVYSTVSDKLLAQQLATTLDDAVKNIPGAGVPVRYNQNRIVFFSRGFLTQPKFRNGLAAFIQTSIDPVNIERIEAIKGPSATLFGSSVVSYGGLLNRVTKKPNANSSVDIKYLAGSWNLNRLTLDLNKPLTGDNKLLFRLNGAYHLENSFQDAGFNNSFAFTPSFSYKVSDKVTMLLDIEYGHNTGTSPIRFTPYTSNGGRISIADMGIDYKRSFASNDVAYDANSLNIFYKIDADMGKHWKSQTAISRTFSEFSGYTSQLKGRSDTTLRAQVTTGEYKYYSTDIQQNFIGTFTGLGLHHKFVFGLDYYHYASIRNTANANSATIDFTSDLTDYYLTYNKAYIDTQSQSASRRIQNINRDTYSAYASDLIDITNNLSALLSLRLDYFKDNGTYDVNTASTSGEYDQTALSPKLGLVYKVLPEKVSVFANYMNGFSNQNGTDKEGNTFKPENAIQYEGGVKADIWKNKLSGYISYFDILVKDVVRDDPDDADYSIQDGEQENKGYEFQINAQPVKGLSLLAGYAYTDSKYTKADEDVQGLRPASAGAQKTINYWINYNLPESWIPRVHIGFGGNYGSESYQTNTHSAQVIIPSYSTMNASIGWESKHINIAVKMDNLTNEKYWSYRLAPQNPRRFVGTVSCRF